jgi:NitT/TauT family transport system ATP-binding protein
MMSDLTFAQHKHGAGEIIVEDVSYSIRDRSGRLVELIARCSFRAERGLFTAVVGPSGCGKTTIMNMIAGYHAPDQGKIFLDGVQVKGASWERLMVFQETALFPWMTTLENVVYGPMVRAEKPLPQIRQEAAALLQKFGLAEFKDRYPNELSGGMQRRGELARVLINDPLVLLMDEPFRGLDSMTRQLMQQYLVSLFEEARTTTLFVTSEIDEAIFLADRLVILSGSPATVASVIEVPLPRPRTLDMLSTPDYAHAKTEALEILYAEAVAAFAGGGVVSDLKESFEKIYAS